MTKWKEQIRTQYHQILLRRAYQWRHDRSSEKWIRNYDLYASPCRYDGHCIELCDDDEKCRNKVFLSKTFDMQQNIFMLVCDVKMGRSNDSCMITRLGPSETPYTQVWAYQAPTTCFSSHITQIGRCSFVLSWAAVRVVCALRQLE